MKRWQCFSVVFLVLLVVYTNPPAQQPCNADFSANDTSICAGDSVIFTANYAGGDAYNWTFENGTPNAASGAGPHTIFYYTPGNYDVELWVTCGNERVNEKKTDYITVTNCACISYFEWEVLEECVPARYRFYSTAVGATKWDWMFEGGTPSTATGEGPHEVVFNAAGHYKIRLNIECAQTKDSHSRSKFIDIFDCDDWGDAPDSYRTKSAVNGARHRVNADIFLGNAIDIDPDGQPMLNADGDDLDAIPNDEDGVQFLTGLVQGQPCNVEVRASVDGWLQVWADLNINDNWADPGEMVLNQTIVAGLNNLVFNVPPDAKPGTTYLRFRYSLNGGLDYWGLAPEGEVEDYVKEILESYPRNDLGDAPASQNHFGVDMTAYPVGGPPGVPARYPTVYDPTLSMFGPIHLWPHEIAWLGDAVSLENQADMGPDEDPQNNIIPEIDKPDLDGADDGVIFPLKFPVCEKTVFEFNVTVKNAWPEPMYVNVWIDWNRNGTWNDNAECPDGNVVSDWAVQNQKIILTTVGVFTFTTDPFITKPLIEDGVAKEMWMRITLSELPWDFPYADAGCGPKDGYRYGETEDYIFVPEIVIDKLDFGDAPDPATTQGYPTLLVHNGARHYIKGPFLGSPPDAEDDGRSSPDAKGDDNDNTDDEDGVYIPTLVAGQSVNILVNVGGGGGYIAGYIDFNGDRNWDPQIRIASTDFYADGMHTIVVKVPSNAVIGQTYARFRINSTNPNLPPDGPADDGEVEDYGVIIEKPIPNSKWVQLPDLTANGIDIKLDEMRHLADDFECRKPSLLTDIHFWGSWRNDKKGRIASLTVSIYSDDPPGDGGSDPTNNYSMPDKLLWSRNFANIANEIAENLVFTVDKPGEYWADPLKNLWKPGGDSKVWRVDLHINPDDAFMQNGTEDKPVIYWLALTAVTEAGEFGWKTRQWPDHFMDDAVWDYGSELPRQWKPLEYPKEHPYHKSDQPSIDLAYVLTFQPVEEEKRDWGDAPYFPEYGGYPTTNVDGGANHIIDGPWLGPDDDAPDSDPDGQPEPAAVGDDVLDGNDDEDGVDIPVLFSGTSATITMHVNGGGGVVEAWIDFNNDKIWQHPGEQIFGGYLPDGSHNHTFPVPGGLTYDHTYARFRISRKGGLGPKFAAPDGEVEDYLVRVRKEEEHPIKWSQPPLRNSDSPEPDCYWGWDVVSVYSKRIVADDWICFDKRPVTDVHWWGSYADWNADAPPEYGPQKFHIGIWTDVPAGADIEYSHPREMLWEYTVERSELNEHYAGCDFYPEMMDKPDACFRYDLILPEHDWFIQPGDTTVLWLSIAAIYEKVPDNYIWGWKSRKHYFMDDAIVIDDPLMPHPGSVYIKGKPVMHSWDMAFELTTNATTEDLDFGDAPDPKYPTLSMSNGARHRIVAGFFLGAGVDAEPEGQPSGDAQRDDQNGQVDDEDGVILSNTLSLGQTFNVRVRASQNGVLNAWIDWNRNGSWADPGEHFIPDKQIPQGETVLNSFAVPDSAVLGETFVRFRFSKERALSYDGFAASGEVEDYRVDIIEGPGEAKHDLGDAPDNSNSHNITNFVAYPSGVVGRFPTVYGAGSPPYGPLHLYPRKVACLGRDVTLENEADTGPDEDPDNNIDPPNNAADMDLRDDCIVSMPPLLHCAPVNFQYSVHFFSADTIMYLNVWFDWNRDGDWNDTMECADTSNVYEWA
ncbi:PKD domain-containing protein, partial [candidate division KSB1 bacterium]|nr:PKD domain-containing protein [candidate division KSB1 bacterium]